MERSLRLLSWRNRSLWARVWGSRAPTQSFPRIVQLLFHPITREELFENGLSASQFHAEKVIVFPSGLNVSSRSPHFSFSLCFHWGPMHSLWMERSFAAASVFADVSASNWIPLLRVDGIFVEVSARNILAVDSSRARRACGKSQASQLVHSSVLEHPENGEFPSDSKELMSQPKLGWLGRFKLSLEGLNCVSLYLFNSLACLFPLIRGQLGGSCSRTPHFEDPLLSEPHAFPHLLPELIRILGWHHNWLESRP